MRKIDLILFNSEISQINWPYGDIYCAAFNPQSLSILIDEVVDKPDANACFFWDITLGNPPSDEIQSLLDQPFDVWHAGLRLDMGEQPSMINFVKPTWMLNRDPDPEIEATSWRLSLQACLVRSEVLKQLGGPDPDFESLAGAGLELGYRYIRKGAFIRHCPQLVPGLPVKSSSEIPLNDQLRFLKTGFDQRWLWWAGIRAVLLGLVSPLNFYKALQTVKYGKHTPRESQYKRPLAGPEKTDFSERVSVVIPTINRYPYLRKLLDQLQNQAVKPYEIFVIDQTPEHFRDANLLSDFDDLPFRYFSTDKAGQCSSRNIALQSAKGDYILFLDDDVEAPSDLIEKHLKNLHKYQSNVSCGVVYEKDNKLSLENSKGLTISDVFPAGNSLIRKDVLIESGLFDLAYDLGQRADGDLGMRIYLSGFLMVLDPLISILHHRAPIGGLREHNARVNTRGGSRSRIFEYNLPSVSDIYLAKRYFSDKQINEMLWIKILGTFSIVGPIWKRILKIIFGIVSLPRNLWLIYKRSKIADEMLEKFPQIPQLLERNSK